MSGASAAIRVVHSRLVISQQNGRTSAVTYDGKDTRIYLNGELKHLRELTKGIMSSSIIALELIALLNRHFKGLIDEVPSLHRCLDDADIAALADVSLT